MGFDKHLKDVSYPVSPILPEFRDQGCYDKHGPVTISRSKQDVAHNDNLDDYIRAIENLAPSSAPTDDCIFHHEVIAALVAESQGDLLNLPRSGRPSSSCQLVGSNPRDLFEKASNNPTLQEIYDLLPKYIITSLDDPLPCLSDGTGAPFILFSQSSNSMMLDVADEYFLAINHHYNPQRRLELRSTGGANGTNGIPTNRRHHTTSRTTWSTGPRRS